MLSRSRLSRLLINVIYKTSLISEAMYKDLFYFKIKCTCLKIAIDRSVADMKFSI